MKQLTWMVLFLGLGTAIFSCKDGMDPEDPDMRMPPHPMIGTYAGDCYSVYRYFNFSNGQWTETLDTFPGQIYVIDSIYNRGDTICSMHTSDFWQYFPLDCGELDGDTIESMFYYSQFSVRHRWLRSDSSLVYTSVSQDPGGPGGTTRTCYYHLVE